MKLYKLYIKQTAESKWVKAATSQSREALYKIINAKFSDCYNTDITTKSDRKYLARKAKMNAPLPYFSTRQSGL